jgi:hypothetical protein
MKGVPLAEQRECALAIGRRRLAIPAVASSPVFVDGNLN